VIETIGELLAIGESRAIALVAPGRDPMTFGELRATIHRLAGQLRALGVDREDRVVIVLPNGPDMAITFLAVASCATAAPLNPKYRTDEFQFYMSDLGAKALIFQKGHNTGAHSAAPEAVLQLTVEGEGVDLALRHQGEPVGATDFEFARSEDLALVLHTSGTTSRPKMVPLTQHNLGASASNIVASLSLTDADRCLSVMPLFHIHGLVAGLLAPLAAGGSIACTPGFDAFRFFGWLDELAPTWYTAVPTMHQVIFSRAHRHSDVIGRVGLRFVRSSSASLPPVVLEDTKRVFGVPVIEAYGMTEASHQMASNPLPPAVAKSGSVGRATGIEISIMDEEGRHLTRGERGEIVIRGETVVKAYENNPEANAKAFTAGWFRTGDEGYLDEEGYLFLTGRLKEIINRGGEKIGPLEIDGVLLRHPAVAQAVAFALPHDKLGEDVAAAVVLADGATATEREIREFAAAHLVDYKVPRTVVIVDKIPKGPTGKLQRLGLAKRLGLAP
jgi:acyl-CoA synthetase (AMP-forming)/AMP-acid ligase II